MYTIGIDIGTSNIAVVLIDDNNSIISLLQHKNSSIKQSLPFESLQDAETMYTITHSLISKLLYNNSYTISGIGISNQMHGILYVDEQGEALSPFYNWQDKRGDQTSIQDPSISISQYVHELTGYLVPTGYGLITHYYNQCFHNIPLQTKYIFDIGNYIIAKLTNIMPSCVHPSNAQSWGFYKLDSQSFDLDALNKLNIDTLLLPLVQETSVPLGHYNNIPVYSALGDNQAGILGAIKTDEDTILINVGTSAQLSFIGNEGCDLLEQRPFIKGKTTWVISSLCGGKTLDIWIHCIAEIIKKIMPHTSTSDISNHMYELLSHIQPKPSDIQVEPYFYGTRQEPNKKASITQLSWKNFNFEELSIGFMQGIVDELYQLWQQVPEDIKKTKQHLVLTGGSTKLASLCHLFEKKFAPLRTKILDSHNEAAFGAALWAKLHIKK